MQPSNANRLAEGTAACEVRLDLILNTEAVIAKMLDATEPSPKMAMELSALRAMMPEARRAHL